MDSSKQNPSYENFEKLKPLKLVIFPVLSCPTVTVQSKQLLHIGTPKCPTFVPIQNFKYISRNNFLIKNMRT